ncbi:MAG: NAD(P)H-hydrate dehydratase [Candidatus Omnitrophica bacterium]|nr:NAD(P)H-hydrate dehydratase [Candidatus Omnitrophota bacterium]
MKNDSTFLKRKKDAHKGDFGHVFVLAGSRGLSGAAYLCSQAALLSGAGLVTVGIPESLQTVMAIKLTEAMTLPLPETADGTLSLKAFKEIKAFAAKCRVLAIGPGISLNPVTQKLVRKIVKETDLPMVIDADGLNALEANPKILRQTGAAKVITPHPGEMARLLGVTAGQIQKNRRTLAKQFACRYNIVTVLKGSGTIIADTHGKTVVNKTGNPGMAKAGTGDVLTGIVAAFCSQGAAPFDAARLAVYVHGLAADYAVKEKGQVSLLAADILAALPFVLKKITNTARR